MKPNQPTNQPTSNAGALGDADYLLIAIAPRSTLSWSSNIR